MTTKKSAATATTTKKPAAKKPVAKAVAKPVRAASKPEAKKAKQKVKVVRDSFTMPENEYRKIAEIKEACLKAGLPVKKSEVLRAGLQVLAGLSAAQLKRALGGLEKIKTGRPKKH
ncbi:hypothetical protein FGKAn22_23700 [Ferrigenium kumadai]|uniref:Uncharacterized protein n=1 Tax=Ferrigenium kumadai TaxID=1682490 RepID=A0AAN1T0V7_9PROT|nr:hypothetical protein [Ferrigenium kumadai]BBJ00678.1 hypothetical protein FGKAn22_23700 [Ferrigenium kumadai]